MYQAIMRETARSHLKLVGYWNGLEIPIATLLQDEDGLHLETIPYFPTEPKLTSKLNRVTSLKNGATEFSFEANNGRILYVDIFPTQNNGTDLICQYHYSGYPKRMNLMIVSPAITED